MVQHLFEANRYPERTVEEFYASKKSHRGAIVQYAGQMEALMALLQDIRNNSKLCWQPDQTLWLDELRKGKPAAMKLAFRILCFASLTGKVNDAKLRGYLVPVLTRKYFSVDWLADKSVEFIQSQLNALGKYPYFAKILKNVAVSIQDEHSYQVLDNLDDLLSILGINSCSARLTLQYAFNQLNVSLVTIGLLLL